MDQQDELLAMDDGDNTAISDSYGENVQYYLDEGYPLQLALEFASQDMSQL